MKILLVDDDIILQNLFKHHLHNLGLEDIVTAQSGEEAISLAEQNIFDIGFFDINLLTELDGIETAKRIKEKQNDLQVIFISANEDPILMERASVVENLGFLNKPYNPELIEQYIKMVKIRLRQKTETNRKCLAYNFLPTLVGWIWQKKLSQKFSLTTPIASKKPPRRVSR